MSAYRPSQRKVHVELLAVPGWLSGIVHVPARTTLAGTFNRRSEFIPLTDATPDPGAQPLEFIAVRRQAIILVVPDAEEAQRGGHAPPGHYEPMHLRCHLHDVTVEGTVEALASLRLSDFLETNAGFITMHDCTLEDNGRTQRYPLLLVNTRHVLAVTEAHAADRKELASV